MTDLIYIDVLELIESLRSGEFQQGKQVLASEDGKFCCLGVACENLTLAGKLVKGMVERPSDQVVASYGATDLFADRATTVLPFHVRFPNSMGISQGAGILPEPFMEVEGFRRYSLAELNDAGMPFSQIADILQYLYDNNK